MYHALHSPEQRSLNLVANYSGTRIYDSRVGWGRLWRIFYAISDRIGKQDWRFDRMKSAILYTHELFHKQLPFVQEHVSNYEHYLQL